jgi:hypothetical protein
LTKIWDITFSKDPVQRYITLTDGQNERVRVILRDTLEELTSFGDGGRQPGAFYRVHSIASDSKGNLYTTETYEGKRVQKFLYKGVSSVARGYQGRALAAALIATIAAVATIAPAIAGVSRARRGTKRSCAQRCAVPNAGVRNGPGSIGAFTRVCDMRY